jgi:hypothetical protein
MVHGAILFGSDNDFAYPKAIVFLSIYMRVFQLAIKSPFYLPHELHKQYEDILLSHCIDRPPFGSLIFDLQEVRIINDFFVNTFFRHLKSILNCFAPRAAMTFKAEFPIHVRLPALPGLAEMEMLESAPPEEEGQYQTDSGSKPKSPQSPRAPQPQQQQQQQVQAREPPVQTRPAPAPELVEGSEDRGPEVPLDALRGTLASMHEKFVTDFEDREKQLIGKIKELEIRLLEKPQLKKPPPKKK